jgi:hypothetical protein
MNEIETTMQLTKIAGLSYTKFCHATYRRNLRGAGRTRGGGPEPRDQGGPSSYGICVRVLGKKVHWNHH